MEDSNSAALDLYERQQMANDEAYSRWEASGGPAYATERELELRITDPECIHESLAEAPIELFVRLSKAISVNDKGEIGRIILEQLTGYYIKPAVEAAQDNWAKYAKDYE